LTFTVPPAVMPRKSKRKAKANAAAAVAVTKDVPAPVADAVTAAAGSDETKGQIEASKTSSDKLPLKKTRKQRKAEKDAKLDTVELARREKQKELQKIIIRLQKRGATKDQIRRAKIQFRHGGAAHATGRPRKRDRDRDGAVGEGGPSAADWRKEQFGDKRYTDESEETALPQKGFDHDLVIVPVFWKKDPEQRQEIINAAEQIKQDIIALVQFDIWIDLRTKYTPGQKFAFWEHRGVKFRVELGPKELASNTCTVSKCENAGTVSQRYKVPLEAAAIIKKLREVGATLGEKKEIEPSSKNGGAEGMVLIRRAKKTKIST